MSLDGLIKEMTRMLLSNKNARPIVPFIDRRRLGRLASGNPRVERNVQVVVSTSGVTSETSSPSGVIDPSTIDYYEITGWQPEGPELLTLIIVLTDKRRVRFYSTMQRFDMALLLDELDGTIGGRRRMQCGID